MKCSFLANLALNDPKDDLHNWTTFALVANGSLMLYLV